MITPRLRRRFREARSAPNGHPVRFRCAGLRRWEAFRSPVLVTSSNAFQRFHKHSPEPPPTPGRVFAAQDRNEPRWLTHARSAPRAPWLPRDPLNTVEWEGAAAFAATPALPCISTSDTPCRTSVGSWPLEADSPQGVPRIASLARCDDSETTPLGPRERTPAVSSRSAFRRQAPHRSVVELRPLANKPPYVDAFFAKSQIRVDTRNWQVGSVRLSGRTAETARSIPVVFLRRFGGPRLEIGRAHV